MRYSVRKNDYTQNGVKTIFKFGNTVHKKRSNQYYVDNDNVLKKFSVNKQKKKLKKLKCINKTHFYEYFYVIFM